MSSIRYFERVGDKRLGRRHPLASMKSWYSVHRPCGEATNTQRDQKMLFVPSGRRGHRGTSMVIPACTSARRRGWEPLSRSPHPLIWRARGCSPPSARRRYRGRPVPASACRSTFLWAQYRCGCRCAETLSQNPRRWRGCCNCRSTWHKARPCRLFPRRLVPVGLSEAASLAFAGSCCEA